MTDASDSKRGLFTVAVAVTIPLALVALRWGQEGSEARQRVHDYPVLFGEAPGCPGGVEPAARAIRAEQQGHFHSERYPYDAHDGIQAVLRFEEAKSCYAASGLHLHARRAGRLASDLMVRINMDYASSRVVLESALASEKWEVALGELRRLLRLTKHVGDHDYVTYLSSVVGKATVHANRAH